jgi:hypothetical protein
LCSRDLSTPLRGDCASRNGETKRAPRSGQHLLSLAFRRERDPSLDGIERYPSRSSERYCFRLDRVSFAGMRLQPTENWQCSGLECESYITRASQRLARSMLRSALKSRNAAAIRIRLSLVCAVDSINLSICLRFRRSLTSQVDPLLCCRQAS